MTAAERISRIKQIEELLLTGVKSAAADGESVTFDLDSLRRELRRLQAEQEPGRRPVVCSIDLSGF